MGTFAQLNVSLMITLTIWDRSGVLVCCIRVCI